MARPVQYVDHGTSWVKRNSILIRLPEDMSIDFRAFATIKIDDLNSDSNRLHQCIDEKGHPKMVYLGIYSHEVAATVFERTIRYKALINIGPAFQCGSS